MRLRMTYLLIGWCGGCGALSAGVVVEGRVELNSAVPAAAPTARYKLKSSAAALKPAPAVAVVYLEGTFPEAVTNAVVELPQKNFQFERRVLPIQKGTRVAFPNYDDDYHNVLSYSRSKPFDLGRYRKDEKPPPILFDKAGVVELDCEIHAHMRATIFVLETPYFTTTDAEGKYRLENLPEGTYTLKAFLNYRTTRSQPVTLEGAGPIRVDFPDDRAGGGS